MLDDPTERPYAELDSWIYTKEDFGREPNTNLISMQAEVEAMKEAYSDPSADDALMLHRVLVSSQRR